MSGPPAILTTLSSRLLPLDTIDSVSPVASEKQDREAAVLVLFFPQRDMLSFLLTTRPETLSRHPGQISLPGGRTEPEDENPWDTAARETEEELGIARELLVPLGRLPTYRLTAGRYRITPCVGWLPELPELRPDRREVANVLQISLSALLDPASVVRDTWRLREADWDVVYYQFDGRQVWGATARILHELGSRLREPLPGELVPGSVSPSDTM